MAEETKKIVRVMRRDLPGERSIENALRSIKGVNFMLARALRVRAGFKPETKIGDLSEADINKIEKMLEQSHKFGIPTWLMNRRKDPIEGIDIHVAEADLMLTNREDLIRMKKMKSYRGIRHMFGLPVRGQRTRSSGRKERTVGVVRKGRMAPGAAPAEGAKPAKAGGK